MIAKGGYMIFKCEHVYICVCLYVCMYLHVRVIITIFLFRHVDINLSEQTIAV